MEYGQEKNCTDPECNVSIRNVDIEGDDRRRERPGNGRDGNLDAELQRKLRVTALATTTPGPPALHDAMITDGIQENRWICFRCLGEVIQVEQKQLYMVAVNDIGYRCHGCRKYLKIESHMEHTALAYVF